jgi:pectate lyase
MIKKYPYLLFCLIQLLIGSWVMATPFLLDSGVRVLAFPGVEGFGKYTSGGRGGVIFRVTQLGDSGVGSFREAAESNKTRIIVFAVSGTIHLKKKVTIKGNVTIAGQTAPGEGICIADQSVSLGGDNIIVRYMRFRMGDQFQLPLKVNGNGGDDALGGSRKKNIVIDHCSISWSTDECFSVYAGDSTTLQWNLIAEPLNYSVHFEEGDTDFEKHGYGAIWGGAHLSAHHNLFAHCKSRTPRFDGIRNAPNELVDFRNNVIYNWGNNNIYAGEGGNYNLVNNYFKYGPDTETALRYQIANPGKSSTIGFGKWYVSGNYVDEAADITKDNSAGIRLSGTVGETKSKILMQEPHPAISIANETAADAYKRVLIGVGASYRRDTLDQRILQNVISRTGKFIDVQGGFPHGTPYEINQSAWPTLKTGQPAKDADQDGIPDNWEISKGLNPTDASDAILFTLDKLISNIELYINSITP